MGSINPNGDGRAGPHLTTAAVLRVKPGVPSLLRRLSGRSLAGFGLGVAVLALVGTAACAAPGSSAATTTRATDTAPQSAGRGLVQLPG